MGRSEKRQWWLVLMSALCVMRSVRAPSVPRDPSADSINVISVENMDTLLRMRLAEDLTSWNGSGEPISPGKPRTQRATEDLCHRPACQCSKSANMWQNISCAFSKQEVLELGPGSFSEKLVELEIHNLAELIILPKTFGNTPALNTVRFSRIGNLRVQSGAFNSINSSQITFQVEDSKIVTLDDHSFRNLKGMVSTSITSCDHLTLGSVVFARLASLHITNVPKLELERITFAAESSKTSHHGPAPLILFENVTFGVIPNETFASSAGEIGFRNCRIKKLSRNSFNTVQISKVFLENTKLDILERGAFSERTLIVQLEFIDTNIGVIETGFVTAVNNLTIRGCRLEVVQEGAFNMTTARLHMVGNHFSTIKRRAFDIHAWNSVIIDRNEFKKLDPDAFAFPFQRVSGIMKYVFEFSNNGMDQVAVSSLSFIPLEAEVEVYIDGNRFNETCSCRLRAWTADLVATDPVKNQTADLAERLYDTSFCTVTGWLATCFVQFRLMPGAVTMVNYTRQICSTSSEFHCKESSPRFYPDDSNLDLSQLLDHEKKIVTYIFVTVLICVTVILLVVAARWVQRKGLIGRIMSQFFRSSSLVASGSISRVNIHEYAEIQNLRNQTQLPEETEFEEEIIGIDDKATQTLPEELTQDLLQSLREKLDDPENYREARYMIEHLYDLIKVEESCNNRASTVLEDTLYAELQPRTRPRVRNKTGTSIGTRSPSLDRLDPVHYLPRPAVSNDYAEPRDRQVSSHVYCELPGGGVPDVLMSSNLMANRPLPEAPTGSRV